MEHLLIHRPLDRFNMSSDSTRHIVQVHVGGVSVLYEALSVEASKQTTADEIVTCIVERLALNNQGTNYELAEVIGDAFGRECKERSLGPNESPVQLMLLWPKKVSDETDYKFYLREKVNEYIWRDNFVMDSQLIKDYFNRFLYQSKDREYPDLCQLPDLNETTLLENLKNRFIAGHIYTYVGSILISVNPFKFFPIYNPKYVKLYQNRRLGPNLPPHIFAVADTAYHCMLKDRKNQCIVISGESGSGKTESTNFLLHHLTALSQKGSHGSGVEQTILSAGPVLEAFGNAKTAHNNNSSRFGKFIQVNYKENGMVHGAVVQKYLLEKSRICTQGRNERNYHVFYYLLEGANEQERKVLHLKRPDQYRYLNKNGDATLENVDESYEFSRLKQSMEMVGFTVEKQRRLFSVLSAVLLLGNVEFQPRKSAYHHDEAVGVKNPEVVALISELLRVKQETLMQALTAKRARASGETLVINYKLPEAIASRDAMAKCLYGALFDWIVLQVNHALFSKKDTLREHQGNSIGVLDIFGFEDFGLCNSFEQLCINYANEHLQHYFNQHVFKYEQEEYRKEGIKWKNIEFMDNTGCLQLIEGKVNGLLCILDDQCNFPGATNETLLQKFNSVHKENKFYQKPQKKEAAFIIVHYAGTVKYQVAEMREKNLDMMRQDIVGVLKNSSMAFVRELVGADPVAVFRWAIVRAFFRAYFAFHEAGRRHRQGRVDGNKNNIQQRYHRNHVPNENIISKQRNYIALNRLSNNRNNESDVPNNHNRLSWPQFYNRKSVGSGVGGGKNAAANDEEPRRVTMRGKDAMTGCTSPTSSSALERVLFLPDQARVMQRANQIVMKNKSFRPRERSKKGLKNLQSVKTLVGRTGLTAANQGQLGKARKQPMTVTAQFQQSLHSLMDTLNQANPFFIRCIKSNAKKIPNNFDEETVQRQLRYTGMLETVRIRQAGFNVRLTYDEFIQHYRILLPKGLLSSQSDVRHFLATLNLDRDNYQLGSSKIFLRESEKLKLDCRLHQQIMASIVTLQRWFRTCLERRRFLRIQSAVIAIQSYCRMFLVQKQVKCLMAVIKIQKHWRAYKTRIWYAKLRRSVVVFQAQARGFVARKVYENLKKQALLQKLQALRLPVGQSSDEDYLFRHFNDEMHMNRMYPDRARRFRDSDESSGFLEDIDSSCSNSKVSLRSTQSLPSVTSQYSSNVSHNSNDRLEDIKKEGILLDYSSLRGKMQMRNLSEAYKSDPNQLGGGGGSGAGGRLDPCGDATSESVVTRSDRYKPYEDFDTTQQQQQQTASEFVHPKFRQHAAVKRDFRHEPKLISMPPIRRRDIVVDKADKENDMRDNRVYEQAPDKAKQMLGSDPVMKTPKPPTRNFRANRRSQVVRSLGEEVVDSIEKNIQLGTIDEFAAPKVLNDKAMQSETDYSASAAYANNSKNASPKRNSRSGLGNLDLRRRNSDPATKVSVVSENPEGSPKGLDLVTWHNRSTFTMGEHKFRRVTKFGEEDTCQACSEKDSFYGQGYKCMNCKGLFHTKCIQNKRVLEISCGETKPSSDSSKPNRRKYRHKLRTTNDVSKQSVNSNFNLTGTSEFTDRTDQIISDSKELEDMQNFITNKILKMDAEAHGKPSEVDRLFKQALREFKDNLVQFYSAVNRNPGFEVYSVKYKDLISNFVQAMETVCQREEKNKDFPVTMCVNAFRGFMDEFMNSRAEPEKPRKSKWKKEKKRKCEDPLLFNGHSFQLIIINVPTVCEICTSIFMWPLERCLVCQSCKLTCHKKCYTKSSNCIVYDYKHVFGVPLSLLVTKDEKIPVVIERLLATIEMYFLYTEGLYRKPGVSSKVKELKSRMDENRTDIKFENYHVHVLASVLKCFLREMPEPLLTFNFYENFITVANIAETEERVSILYEMLKKLPTPNYNLMERLIFHLARVAQHEASNRMSAASLAIVFAPCILRTNKVLPAQDSLHDITNQTLCIETIISEQLRKIRNTLDDIDTLDTVCQAATNRLSSLRSSKVFSPDELLPSRSEQAQVDDEENMLETHIQEMQFQKEILTSTLPNLTHATSDDDMLSTDGDGSLDDISCVGEQKRLKGPIIRTISSGGGGGGGGGNGGSAGSEARQSNPPKLKRQSTSDVTIVKAVGVDECAEDAPIMV